MKYRLSLQPLLSTFRTLVIPGIGEYIACLLIAIIIYTVASLRYWLDVLSGGDSQLKQYTYEMLADLFSNISHLPYVPNIVNALIWGVGGICIYVLLMLLFNFFIISGNNAAHNSALRHVTLRMLALAEQYRRAIWILIFITVLGCTVFTLFPYWLECFTHFNYSHRPQYIIGSLVGLAYNIYVLYASTVAVFRNPRLFIASY